MRRLGDSHDPIAFDGKYPVVFSSTYRRKVLVNGVDARLNGLLHTKALEPQRGSAWHHGHHFFIEVKLPPVYHFLGGKKGIFKTSLFLRV